MATNIPNFQIPNMGAAALMPDALKVRPVTSYPTAAQGLFNQEAFQLAGVPQNYVAPPTPPPSQSPPPAHIPQLPPNFNFGGMFGGLGGINWMQLLQQYGGLLNRQQTPSVPTQNTQMINPDLQGLLSQLRAR